MTDQNNILKKSYSPEDFRKNGYMLVDMLAEYIKKSTSGEEMPVLPDVNPELMLGKYTDLFESGNFELEHFFKNVLDDSIHLHHPNYIGHQVVPAVPLSGLSELFATLLNNGMAVYEMGPAATAIEKVVINWLGNKFGYSDGDGFLTSGGSLGNLTALLAARQAKTSYNIWDEGVRPDKIPVMLVSGEAHYSISRAVKIMGLGEKNIVSIKSDRNFKADLSDLTSKYMRLKDEGREVITVVANACSTSTGTYDNLKDIARFCRQNNLWLHVDAAHGGPAVFSNKYKYLLQGIENADSIVVDFHKMMLASGLTTAVLFKDRGHSYETFAQKASYLLDKNKFDWYNSAKRTMECTKKSMSIKLFAMISLYGEKLFKEFVTSRYDLAKQFAQALKDADDFELATEPEANIVCFRHICKTADLNNHNKLIRERILEDEEFYIVQTEINEAVYLRVSIMNPFTSMEHLNNLINKIRQLA